MIDGLDGLLGMWRGVQALTTASPSSVRAAPGAGLQNYIRTVIIDNMAITTARIIIKGGSTVIFTATVPPSDTRSFHLDPPVGGGDNQAVTVELSAIGNVNVQLLGYIDS